MKKLFRLPFKSLLLNGIRVFFSWVALVLALALPLLAAAFKAPGHTFGLLSMLTGTIVFASISHISFAFILACIVGIAVFLVSLGMEGKHTAIFWTRLAIWFWPFNKETKKSWLKKCDTNWNELRQRLRYSKNKYRVVACFFHLLSWVGILAAAFAALGKSVNMGFGTTNLLLGSFDAPWFFVLCVIPIFWVSLAKEGKETWRALSLTEEGHTTALSDERPAWYYWVLPLIAGVIKAFAYGNGLCMLLLHFGVNANICYFATVLCGMAIFSVSLNMEGRALAYAHGKCSIQDLGKKSTAHPIGAFGAFTALCAGVAKGATMMFGTLSLLPLLFNVSDQTLLVLGIIAAVSVASVSLCKEGVEFTQRVASSSLLEGTPLSELQRPQLCNFYQNFFRPQSNSGNSSEMGIACSL